MGIIMVIISAIFIILGIIIGTQNGNTLVNFEFLKWHYENLSLTLLLIEALLVGAFITIIIAMINEIHIRHKLWQKNKEIKKLEDELKAVKSIPLEETETATETTEEEE